MRYLLVCIMLITLTPRPAHAFSEGGHHIIAVMAFQALPPDRQRELLGILARHPTFESDFKAPENVNNKKLWLIGRAGYWPDVARRSEIYNRPSWHYQLGSTLNIGKVTHPGDPDLLPTDATMESQDLHIVQAIQLCKQVLNDEEAQGSERALALCWLCHLIADIHQPCHAGSLYVENIFPEGDRGANSIKTLQGGNLHALWDGLLGRRYDEGGVQRRIKEIREQCGPFQFAEVLADPSGTVLVEINGKRQEIKVGQLVRLSRPEAFVSGSRALARTHVYAPEVMEPVTVAFRSGSREIPKISLSPEYLKRAGNIAREQAHRAAERLAVALK